jgi:hypothetical protein
VTPGTVLNVLKDADANRDGNVTFDEFRHLTLLLPASHLSGMFSDFGEGQTYGYYSIPKGEVKSKHAAATIFGT